MRLNFTLAVLLTLTVCAWQTTSAQAVTGIGIGTLGDSYTEEYDDISARNKHRNWVEQLGNSGGLDDEIVGGLYNFGAYRQGFPNPTNPTTWDNQRNQGFEYNWAQSGETTNGVINDQLGTYDNVTPSNSTRLTGQVVNGDVGIVMIFAGVNDFGDFTMNQTQLDAEVADVVGNLNTMITTLRAADPSVKIVVGNIHDRSIWPKITGDGSITAQQRQNISTAIQDANAQILADVNAFDIPVIDAFTLLNDFALAPGTGKTFAGEVVRNDITNFGDTDEPGNSLWADDAHAGTVWQGIFANTFLTALDTAYGDDFSAGDLVLLDNQTIWDNAYAGPGGTAPTATSDVFDYGSYVLFPDPPTPLVGDYDNSGDVGQTDLDLVLQFWGDTVADGQAPDPTWINADDVTASLIGQDELALVLQNWGNTSAILAELENIASVTDLTADEIASLIPEPASVMLLVGGLVGLTFRRRV